jgi:hypothetical protein
MRCNHGSARYQATDRQQMPLEEANVKRHATGDLLTRDTDAAGTPKRGKNLASSSSKITPFLRRVILRCSSPVIMGSFLPSSSSR